MKQKVQLKDIASYSKGQQINGDKLNENGAYDYLNGGINPSGKWDSYNVDGNTVTISEGGNSSGYVNYMNRPFWCGAHCYYLFNVVGNTKYLYYALKSQQDRIMKIRSGACMPNIKKTDLGNFEFLFDDDMLVQHQVVEVLDKIWCIIDQCKRQLAELNNLIKSRFVEIFGDPETNTKGWPIAQMSNLCSVGSSKRIYQSEQSSEGVPFWRISDLTNFINTGVATENLHIPEKRYVELQSQGQVPAAGDILVTSRGTLGLCYIVKTDDKFYFQDGMISWLSQYADEITPLYISYLFSMSGFRKQIDSMQAGSTVAYLSIAMIKKLKVMVPNEETQQQFAAFVHQVDKLKVEVQGNLEKTQLLFDSLMQQYFG